MMRDVEGKPLGKTERRRVFTASACCTIVASGSSAMSIAVTGVCCALDAAVRLSSAAKHIPTEVRTFGYISKHSSGF